ncbi:hypothetical protein DFH07DRAFT_782343 [Mycena maculata]|uniref:Uncharacterized protein n=1 Tax=Mycena maculata TaxID=230809 RepID=A0AAD7HT72_9AGAR|nr:hypothetical protein DFH07DRAFT_782343 [Mycena maculata]
MSTRKYKRRLWTHLEGNNNSKGTGIVGLTSVSWGGPRGKGRDSSRGFEDRDTRERRDAMGGGRERERRVREREGRRAKMKEESNEQNDGIKARNPQCARDRINDQAEFKRLVNSEFATCRAAKSAASAYTMPFRLSARPFKGKSLSFNTQWESKVKLGPKVAPGKFSEKLSGDEYQRQKMTRESPRRPKMGHPRSKMRHPRQKPSKTRCGSEVWLCLAGASVA